MLENEKTVDPRVLTKLRERLGVEQEEVSDEELIEMTTGTTSRAFVDLDLALSDFKTAVKTAISDDWRRLRRFFRRDA